MWVTLDLILATHYAATSTVTMGLYVDLFSEYWLSRLYFSQFSHLEFSTALLVTSGHLMLSVFIFCPLHVIDLLFFGDLQAQLYQGNFSLPRGPKVKGEKLHQVRKLMLLSNVMT